MVLVAAFARAEGPPGAETFSAVPGAMEPRERVVTICAGRYTQFYELFRIRETLQMLLIATGELPGPRRSPDEILAGIARDGAVVFRGCMAEFGWIAK